MSDGEGTKRTTPGPNADAAGANARRHSEGTTLAFAVAVAVALGVACGVWINSLMAAASAGRAAPSRPPSEVRADTTTTPVETGTAHESNETAEVSAEPEVTVLEGRTSKPDPTPAAREASPQPKADARQSGTREVLKGSAPERGERREAPCTLYASVGSLTLRGGGAAPLVLGGPGEAGRVAVSTPDWSNIAVLYEGRAGNGWLRYTVKSVSGRPGVYTVRFVTPCGSKTIGVTVK
jgi:hypothetical protein